MVRLCGAVGVSRDGGASWSSSIDNDPFYNAGAIYAAIDDPEVLYGLGFTGFNEEPPIIGQSFDFGETWDDKTGNLTDFIEDDVSGQPLTEIQNMFGW